MSIRVLRSADVPATTRPEVWLDDSAGYRQILHTDLGVIAADDIDTLNRAAHFVMTIGDLDGKSVAWIGGGLCIGPRMFALARCTQDVYEIEPSLREFCPDGVAFAVGDWRNTLTSKYDIIIYDLGDQVPRDILTKHLNPGGIILPIED